MKKTVTNKIKKTTAAVVTATGVAAGSIFGSPEEILSGPSAPQAISYELDEGTETEEEDGGEEEVQEKTGRKTLKETLLGLPFAVRAFVIVPLWFLGFTLIRGASFLYQGLIAPLAAPILGIVLALAALLLALCLGARAAFPDMPVRKILSKWNLKFAGCSLLILYLVCKAGGDVSESFRHWRPAIMFGGGLLILLIMMMMLWREDRYAYAIE